MLRSNASGALAPSRAFATRRTRNTKSTSAIVFRQSVRRRLRSDSPVLAELSGGLDSSSIVCMADDILAKEGAETPRLDTLSYYDKTEPNGDDWIYFQKIEAEAWKSWASTLTAANSELRRLRLNAQSSALCPELSALDRSLDDERADVVRGGGYRAVLSGIGGDEFMGGVPDPRAQLADLIVQFKFVSLAKQLMAWSLVKRRPWIQLLWQSAIDVLPASLGQYLAKEAKVEPWIRKDFAKRTRLAIRQLDVDEHFGLWLPTRRSVHRRSPDDGQQSGEVYGAGVGARRGSLSLSRSDSDRVRSLHTGRSVAAARVKDAR